MTTIYFHSPFPPDKTGIADYSAEIVVELAKEVDLVLVRYGDSSNTTTRLELPSITHRQWKNSVAAASAANDIYQIGNNLFHWEIIKNALNRPGISVIHDGSLAGVTSHSPLDYERFCLYELGSSSDIHLLNRHSPRSFGWQNFVVRNLGLLVDSSKSVVVHSQYLERLIKRRYRQNNLFRTNHHLAPLYKSRCADQLSKRALEFISRHPQAKKISTFGFLTPQKRIDWLVEAFRKALDCGIDAVLILGGELQPDMQLESILIGIPPERVYISGYLTEDEMLALMSISDLQVTLRFPSVGESSGTLTRALGLGIPSVILDVEAFSDFSDQHVEKIALTDHVPNDLADFFVAYADNPSRFQVRARTAQQHVHKQFSINESVKCYLRAVEEADRRATVPSAIYPDISHDIVQAFGKASYLVCEDKEAFPAEFMEKCFSNFRVRELMGRHRCELVLLEGYTDQLTDDLSIQYTDSRRLFLTSSAALLDENALSELALRTNAKTFDIFCNFVFETADFRETEKANRLNRAGSTLNNAVEAAFHPRAVVRSAGTHTLFIGSSSQEATDPELSVRAVVTLVIYEVLR